MRAALGCREWQKRAYSVEFRNLKECLLLWFKEWQNLISLVNKTAKSTSLNTLAIYFTKRALPLLVSSPLAARTPLSFVFAECEASVVEGSDHRL